MLKSLSAATALLASTTAFATSTYRCEAPGIGEEGLNLTWNVGTINKIPSRMVLGYAGASEVTLSGPMTLQGFWHTDKRIWIEIQDTSSNSNPLHLVIKAVGDGMKYEGKIKFRDRVLPITCQQRG